MSKPTRGSWKKLVKLGKYLKAHDRSGYLYQYQALPEGLTVWTDTDYAGCKKTRKSTSGGVVMWGSHLIKSWSSTQSVIALFKTLRVHRPPIPVLAGRGEDGSKTG